MISALFSLLLVPVMPHLEDPVLNHGTRLAELQQRLKTDEATQPPVQVLNKELALPAAELPLITGRIFDWSNKGKAEQQQEVLLDNAVEALRLTGIIESSGQRVAILNDGQRDHVVGQGSYVLNAYQVASLDGATVVLVPISRQVGRKKLELNLLPQATAGGKQ